MSQTHHMTRGPSPTLEGGAFEDLVERHRREIELHCYRMLGSIHDAQDAAQDAFLGAWRGREAFEGRSSFRGWLYRIATNTCLRALERRATARRIVPQRHGPAVAFEALRDPADDIAWLEPFPIDPVAAIPDATPGPAAHVEIREAVQLAFVAAIQDLPPRQRAALLLHDVIGLSSEETAAALETSIAAVNSAIQRARATLRRRYPSGQPSVAGVPDDAQRRLLDRYVRAWEATDVDDFVGLLASDARWTMPPWREWYVGRAAIGAFLAWVWRRGSGRDRLVPTWANGQPAFGYYRIVGDGPAWRPFAIQVVGVDRDRVRSIDNFVNADLFADFGLPARLTATDR